MPPVPAGGGRTKTCEEGRPGVGQGRPAAAAAALAEARAPSPAEPSSGQEDPAGRGAGPASQTAGRVAKGHRRPALPACPGLTSWAAATDRARCRAPRRVGPRRRSRPLGVSGALSAPEDFVVSRPGSCASLSPTMRGRDIRSA